MLRGFVCCNGVLGAKHTERVAGRSRTDRMHRFIRFRRARLTYDRPDAVGVRSLLCGRY
jgi:hypothetical protein